MQAPRPGAPGAVLLLFGGERPNRGGGLCPEPHPRESLHHLADRRVGGGLNLVLIVLRRHVVPNQLRSAEIVVLVQESSRELSLLTSS